MVVGNSFNCDKDCPYCTAKITVWPKGDDNWHKMKEYLELFRKENIVFEYLTISGNGEPSLNSYNDLNMLKNLFEEYSDLFYYKRFQTSGNIFWNDKVFDLFRDYAFEITRVSTITGYDMDILKYTKDYTKTDNFAEAQIIFNHVILKNNINNLLDDINYYLTNYSNLYTLNLKILNLNTLDESRLNNPYSKWILDNAIQKSDYQKIVKTISREYKLIENYNPFFDRFEWATTTNIPITLYARKIKYGLPNIVYYRGDLVDYQLNPKKI